MKKLLLILLTPIIYLTSCSSSKDGLTPETGNIEETIVGKTWKLLDTDFGWFHLNNNNTYLTKDYLCDTLEQFGTWELDGSVLIFTYTDGPIEYIERNTIIDYNDSLVKVQADTSATLDINIIFELVTADVVRGCMDSTFLNFNPNAQCPDTCMNTPVYGCMDVNALNYDVTANIDDGSCCYVAGCIDNTAPNYDPNACFDDGSCCYIGGCMDATALNYNANACFDDGSCCYVAGCIDNTAPNYDPNACFDDGSCIGIGDTYQGGIIFYLDGNGGGLIAAPSDQPNGIWGCGGTSILGTDSAIGTGAQNTIIIEAGCTTPGTAAHICANLTLGGYSDWFLPSKNELNFMWTNLADSDGNDFNGGLGDPGNLGGFARELYWSSTAMTAGTMPNTWAYDHHFGYGGQSVSVRTHNYFVRAVRAF